jgi:predicted nucleic acid-binding protein
MGHPRRYLLIIDSYLSTTRHWIPLHMHENADVSQRLLAFNLLFLPVELSIVSGAQPERASAGLLTNDSIIVAAMRGYGVSLIANNDRQFDAVPDIAVFSPTDINKARQD